MSENNKHNELKKDNNDSGNKRGWKIFDAIFSAGIFRVFYESEKARKENDDKKFKQMIYGSVFGLLFFVLFMTVAIMLSN
ncbi:hypothetical protein ACERII_24685 [Evansella sp. AB-rgal1]|uniref:hypothetical protein n=1 Tax=Evansella sp. AB-rgal1 TaxID=3242696 RepID=UPI00359E68EC